jgi:hypothetical protein
MCPCGDLYGRIEPNHGHACVVSSLPVSLMLACKWCAFRRTRRRPPRQPVHAHGGRWSWASQWIHGWSWTSDHFSATPCDRLMFCDSWPRDGHDHTACSASARDLFSGDVGMIDAPRLNLLDSLLLKKTQLVPYSANSPIRLVVFVVPPSPDVQGKKSAQSSMHQRRQSAISRDIQGKKSA